MIGPFQIPITLPRSGISAPCDTDSLCHRLASHRIYASHYPWVHPSRLVGLDTINRTFLPRRISRPPRDSLWLSPAYGLAPRTTTVRLIVAPRDWHVSGTMQMGIHFPPLCLHPCLFVMLHVTGKMYSGSRTSREAVAVQFFGVPSP